MSEPTPTLDEARGTDMGVPTKPRVALTANSQRAYALASIGVLVRAGTRIPPPDDPVVTKALQREIVYQRIAAGTWEKPRGHILDGIQAPQTRMQRAGTLMVRCTCGRYGFVMDHCDMAACPGCGRMYLRTLLTLVVDSPRDDKGNVIVP